MNKFIETELIKAGSAKLSLGIFQVPPSVDCRVLAEDNYQILKEAYDIHQNGEENGTCDDWAHGERVSLNDDLYCPICGKNLQPKK